MYSKDHVIYLDLATWDLMLSIKAQNVLVHSSLKFKSDYYSFNLFLEDAFKSYRDLKQNYSLIDPEFVCVIVPISYFDLTQHNLSFISELHSLFKVENLKLVSVESCIIAQFGFDTRLVDKPARSLVYTGFKFLNQFILSYISKESSTSYNLFFSHPFRPYSDTVARDACFNLIISKLDTSNKSKPLFVPFPNDGLADDFISQAYSLNAKLEPFDPIKADIPFNLVRQKGQSTSFCKWAWLFEQFASMSFCPDNCIGQEVDDNPIAIKNSLLSHYLYNVSFNEFPRPADLLSSSDENWLARLSSNLCFSSTPLNLKTIIAELENEIPKGSRGDVPIQDNDPLFNPGVLDSEIVINPQPIERPQMHSDPKIDTQILVLSLPLTAVFSFSSIKMPIFQRAFGWGSKGKESKAVEYFKQFLNNDKANDFFGSLFMYSTVRHDHYASSPQDVNIFLADGQHRAVSVNLAAYATKQILNQLISDNLFGADLADCRNDCLELINSDILNKFRASTLEVVFTDNGDVYNVFKFLEESLALIEGMEATIKAISEKYSSKQEELEAGGLDKPSLIKAKATLADERLKAIKDHKDMVANTKKHPLLKSYIDIYYFIKFGDDDTSKPKGNIFKVKPTKSAYSIVKSSSILVNRLKSLNTCSIILQPDQAQIIDHICDTLVEQKAFEMFTQMNGEAVPLNPGELFKSWINQKSKNLDSNLHDYFDKDDPLNRGINMFIGQSAPSAVDFLHKFGFDIQVFRDDYAWARQFYRIAPDASKEKLDYFENIFRTLNNTADAINKCSADFSILFKVFMDDCYSISFGVFIARFITSLESDKKPISDAELLKLLKVLLLMSIMISYIPKSGNRPNIGRDIPYVKGTILDGLNYVLKHFEIADNPDVAARISDFSKLLQNHITTFNFTHSKFRPLLKIMLLISNYDKYKSMNKYFIDKLKFELILNPETFEATEFTNQLDSFPTEIQEAYIPFLSSDDSEFPFLTVGNCILTANKRPKNFVALLPFQKIENTEDSASNAQTSHDLPSIAEVLPSNKVWSKQEIIARNNDIASKVAAWLTSNLI